MGYIGTPYLTGSACLIGSLYIFPTGSYVPYKGPNRNLAIFRPVGSKQVSANLVPRLLPYLGFDTRLNLFDTSSMVPLHSTLRFSPDRFLTLPFPSTLTTTPLECRSCGWFTTPACTAVVDDLPPSLIQLQYLWSVKSLLTS